MSVPEEIAKKKILIADDEEGIREILAVMLRDDGFDVVTAENGVVAQEILKQGGVHIVISDVKMGALVEGGIELLHFVRRLGSIPVILITGFSQLIEINEAYQMGASGFLAKPFKKKELLELVTVCLKAGEVTVPEDLDLDSNFSKLSIDDFVSGQHIKYAIYIRLSKKKYVKIAHQGEDVSVEGIRNFKNKGIKFLYLEKGEFYQYLKTSLLLTSLVKTSKVRINREKKLSLLKHTTEVVMEFIHSNEISNESFEDAKLVMENTVDYLAEDTETSELLDALNNHCDHLYAHSLGVSMYSVMMARNIGWTSDNVLFKISIAGLLHDIGYKEIDPAILAKTRIQMTSAEIKKFESHPMRGMEILSKVSSVPTDLMQVVLHHHERDRGAGYPNQLHKAKTHPIARLIAVADEFCEMVVKNPNSNGMTPRNALARLFSLQESGLDMLYLDALAQILMMEDKNDGKKVG